MFRLFPIIKLFKPLVPAFPVFVELFKPITDVAPEYCALINVFCKFVKDAVDVSVGVDASISIFPDEEKLYNLALVALSSKTPPATVWVGKDIQQ